MAGQAVASAFVTIIPEMKGFGRTLGSQVSGSGRAAGDQIGREMGEAGTQSFKGHFALAGAIGGAVAIATQMAISAIGGLAREAVQASDATDKFKKTLDFAGLDNGTIEALTKSARSYADATVYSLTDIQTITAQLAANGVTGFDKLAEAAGNLNAVAGGNAETFGRVGLVVTQVSGAGRLMTQDWNQLVNAIPGASGKIQEALLSAGAYTGNFREAMEQGQITADEFNAAILLIGADPIAVEAARSVETFEGAIGNLQAAIVGSLSDAFTAVKPVVTDVINALTAGIDAVSGFAQQVGSVFSAAGGGIEGFQATLASIGTNVLAWVSSGGLAQAIGSIAAARAQFFDAITNALPGIIEALVAFIPQMVGVIADLIPQLVSQFAGIVTSLAQTLTTGVPMILNAIAAVLPQIVSSVAGMLPDLVTTLLAMIPTLLTTALTVFQSLVQAIITVVPQLIQTIVDMLPQLVESIISMLPGIIESALALFNGLVQGLIEVIPVLLIAILDALPAIVKAIVDMLPDIIMAAIELFLGLVLGLVKALPELLTTIVTNVIPAAIEAIVSMLPELISGALELFLGIVEGLLKAVPELINALIKMGPQMNKALIDMIPMLIDLGFQLIQGLAKGWMDNLPRIVDWVTNSLGDLLLNGVKDLFGIKSPSRVFYGFGSYMIDGLVNGLNDGERAVQKAVDGIGNVVDTAFGVGGTFDATASIGYGAPSVPNPVTDYAQVASSSGGDTVVYYAAPNASIDSEQALNIALKRAKVLASW